MTPMRVLFWRLVAILFVIIGLVGVVVPVMPTTVFLLVAAWAAARGWPELERWLLEHPRFGPPIRLWRTERAVPRKAKYAAAVTMLISMVLIVLSSAALPVKILVPLFLLIVLGWLWLRPEPQQ